MSDSEKNYEASKSEVEQIMSLYEQLLLKLKQVADAGDIHARCLFDIISCTYQISQKADLLDFRNDVIKFYQDNVLTVKNNTETAKTTTRQ